MPRWWRYMSDEELARHKRLAKESRFTANTPMLPDPDYGYSPTGQKRCTYHHPFGQMLVSGDWRGVRCDWPRNRP